MMCEVNKKTRAVLNVKVSESQKRNLEIPKSLGFDRPFFLFTAKRGIVGYCWTKKEVSSGSHHSCDENNADWPVVSDERDCISFGLRKRGRGKS